jgi:cytoskeleton protein RodZ
MIVPQLGELLKSTREEQGLTLADVSTALRIRRNLLEALEQNNFKPFPSPVITRGLIRNYAKYLHLDPIQALTLYDGKGIMTVKGQRLTPNGIEFMNLAMSPRPLITWDIIMGIFFFLVVVIGASYLTYTVVLQPQMTPTPTKTPSAAGLDSDAALLLPTVTPTPTSTPTPLPPTATPTPIVYGGVTVQLIISKPSWIQILADDTKVFEGILQAGVNRSWSGQRRVAVRAGNAGGVEVIVNGASQGIMGLEGQVSDRVWEKADSTLLTTPPLSTTVGLTNTIPLTQSLPPAPTSAETPLPLQSAPAETPPQATPQGQ